jgi:hypothetical protein
VLILTLGPEQEEQVLLGEQIKLRLQWEDGGATLQTSEQITEQFRAAGVPCFPAVTRAFSAFGGGRLRMREDGRFKIDHAGTALLAMKRHPVTDEWADDPAQFRMEFGHSEKSQSRFTIDGHGQIYEDGQRVGASMAAWLEALSRGGGRWQSGS